MTTSITPKEITIRIAIPTADGRLHGHFGGCREFTLVDADTQNRVVIATQIIPAPPHKPGLYPRWLREQGVRVSPTCRRKFAGSSICGARSCS